MNRWSACMLTLHKTQTKHTSMQKAAQHQQAASRSKTDMDATSMCSAMTKLVTLMLTIAPDFPQ